MPIYNDIVDFVKNRSLFVAMPTTGYRDVSFYNPEIGTWAGNSKIGYLEMEPVKPSQIVDRLAAERYSNSVHIRARICIISFVLSIVFSMVGLAIYSVAANTVAAALMSISAIAFMSWMEQARHEQKCTS